MKTIQSPIFGWILVVVGAAYLLWGILANDMGGLASLGYNPDAPMSLQAAPFRFILGLAINACIVFAGIQIIRKAKAGEQ